MRRSAKWMMPGSTCDMGALRAGRFSPRPIERMVPGDRDSSDDAAAPTIRAPYIMLEPNHRGYPHDHRAVDSRPEGTRVLVLRSESPGRVTYWLVHR